MASPQTNTETFMEMRGNSVEHMDSIQKPLEELVAADDETERRMLRSRIDEQSGLICMLKQRSDELLLRCQVQQTITTELEARAAHCQGEVDVQRKKAETFERRFTDLAADSQGIIAFMQEHKKQNQQLKLENKQLKLENESIFSQALQDKEVFIQKLTQDIKLLTEEHADKEIQYCKNMAECESKRVEQAAQHETKEASLLGQLHDALQQHANAEKMCRDLRTRLQETKEQHAAAEISMKESLTNLTKEKDKLLLLSLERGKIIQEKQEEIQQLVTKWKEEKKARVEAEERFEIEAVAVNKDAKLNSLQSALDESMKKIENLKKDFKAYKEHSHLLLTQERELNEKLRHLRL